MDEAKIKAMAMELAKDFKTPEDLNQLSAMFKKMMIETALNTELTEYWAMKSISPKNPITIATVPVPKWYSLLMAC